MLRVEKLVCVSDEIILLCLHIIIIILLLRIGDMSRCRSSIYDYVISRKLSGVENLERTVLPYLLISLLSNNTLQKSFSKHSTRIM